MLINLRVLAIFCATSAIVAAPISRVCAYTIVETGTITSGTSGGLFGANGTDLSGLAFSFIETLAPLPYYNYSNAPGNNYQYLEPDSTLSLTIGGYTYNFGGDGSYYLASMSQGYYQDEIFVELITRFGTLIDFYTDIHSSTDSFLQSIDLSQDLGFTVPNDVYTLGGVSFSSDGTQFTGSVTSVILNDGSIGPSSVPEPGTEPLLGAGLSALIWFRQRQSRGQPERLRWSLNSTRLT